MRAPRERLARLDRAEIDDRTRALRRESAFAEDLGAQPRTALIDVGEACPLLIRDFEKRNDGLDPRVVHEDVDRADLLPSTLDGGFDVLPFRDVAFHDERAPAF